MHTSLWSWGSRCCLVGEVSLIQPSLYRRHHCRPHTGLPHDRGSSLRGLIEESVPEREELVTPLDGISDESRGLGLKQPWLTPPGVQVGVSSEERVEGATLVPPHQQLYFGVLEESTNVSCRERGRVCVPPTISPPHSVCVSASVCVCMSVYAYLQQRAVQPVQWRGPSEKRLQDGSTQPRCRLSRQLLQS